MIIEQINRNLLKKELMESRSKYLLCTLIMGLIAVLSVVFYPGNKHDILNGSLNQFIYSTGVLPQIGSAVAILLGMGLFSLERAQGTALFLLSTPLSRDTVFHTKTVAGLLMLCRIQVTALLLILITARLLGYPLAIGPLMAVFVLTLTGIFFVFMLTVLFSVLTTDPVKAGVYSASCSFVLYAAALFNTTRVVSPFYYMSGAAYLHGPPSYPWLFLPVILLLSIVLYILARHLWRHLEV